MARMFTITFGFLRTGSIIFSIFLNIGVRYSYSTPDSTFYDQPPHQLIKRQNDGDASSCEIPVETTDKIYAVTEFNGNPVENPQPGLPVSKGASIELRCVQDYAFEDGTNSSKSFCSPNGKWHPALKPCLHICKRLLSDNMELSCRFAGRDIDCSKTLLSGTIVTPRCKDLFHPSQKYEVEYTSIRCLDNGGWDYNLYRCVPDCGKPGIETLSIGGQNASLGQAPWHVAIFSLKAVQPLICGGTLITTNVVISAAHCFYDAVKKIAKKNPADYEIAVAKLTRDRTKIDHPVQKTFQIADIIFYDRPYDLLTTGTAYDIALIILKESVTISTEVLPACFRGESRRTFNPGAGVLGLLAGWGLTETGKPSQVLQTIKIPFMNSTECVKKLTVVSVDKFCAGNDTGPRPQKGDSGGGLMFKERPNSDYNIYYVRGIVSTTDKYTDLSVTTFTDVLYYLEWIERILEGVRATEKTSDEDGSPITTIRPTTTTKSYCQTPLTYRGCYEITPKSSLLNNRISNNHTTPEACVEFCATWQNSFAGISNQECLCGQHVPSDLLKRSDSECSYPCQGSCFKKLTCGGKSKVSIYETGVKTAQSIPSRFYLGCFKDDNPNARVLNGTWNPFYNDNSPHKCHQHCFNTGFIYFGLTFFHECFCGDTNPAVKDAKPESECTNACTGNAKEICGGGWRLSVYSTGMTNYPENGRYVGCFKNVPTSELNVDIRIDITPMSNRRCLNYCTFRGYKYSGVLKGNVCGCLNIPPPQASQDDDLSCEKQACSGDAIEMCGDTDRVKVYRTRVGDTTALSKIRYKGCYEDRNDIRMIEEYQVSVEGSISGELCADICRNKEFAFSSVDDGKECYCGHTYPSPSLQRFEPRCKLVCKETSPETCGPSTRIAVYETGLPRNEAQVSRTYLGCFKYGEEEEEDKNPFKGSTQVLKNSPEVCHRLCLKTGFLYFGLTKANTCSCGDTDPTSGQVQAETDCIKECSGDANKKCGNDTLFSVYKTGLEEIPLQGMKPLGCYPSDGHSLHKHSVVLPTSNAPKRCLKICVQLGFHFAGTEDGSVCRCGSDGSERPAEKDKAKCNSQCSGSPKETCGGSNYVDVYTYPIPSTNRTQDKCKISDSTRNGKPICKYEMMLRENFNALNTSIWKYSVRMASEPDYEFVTYSKSPQIVYVKDGRLYIKPIIWLEHEREGKETLKGCTGTPHTEECTRIASTANILPPVLSAQITTAESLSFRYGRLDIRAKFPSGDWIVPQIWLTPKQPSYGTRYASGQIRIAYIRGNTNLLCGGKEFGSRTLQGGMIFGPPNYTVMLTNRTESAEEWSKDFHNYSLVWTKENISFFVDGKVLARYPQQPTDTVVSAAKLPQNVRYIGLEGSKLAPFDKEFYITLGVSVGGLRDFPDSCTSNGVKKPWTNLSPAKAMLDFWKKRDGWKSSWSGDGPALQIDHIHVAAL